jgi:hypothetical protein
MHFRTTTEVHGLPVSHPLLHFFFIYSMFYIFITVSLAKLPLWEPQYQSVQQLGYNLDEFGSNPGKGK